MKKLYGMLLVLALLLPVLTGCRSSAPAAKQTNPPVTPQTSANTESATRETTLPAETDAPQNTPTQTETVTKLTREEARDIALKHAGFTANQVKFLETELDRDDGVLHYDVEFEADGYDYDYEIDAATGKILKSEKERD